MERHVDFIKLTIVIFAGVVTSTAQALMTHYVIAKDMPPHAGGKPDFGPQNSQSPPTTNFRELLVYEATNPSTGEKIVLSGKLKFRSRIERRTDGFTLRIENNWFAVKAEGQRTGNKYHASGGSLRTFSVDGPESTNVFGLNSAFTLISDSKGPDLRGQAKILVKLNDGRVIAEVESVRLGLSHEGNDLLPDLSVWANRMRRFMYGWTLDRHTQPGHVLLRLTTAVPNVGAGSLRIRGGEQNPDGTQDVWQVIEQRHGAPRERLAGTFVFHPEHGHVHFEGFAIFRLREVTAAIRVGDVVAAGDKVSFCLMDYRPYDLRLPNAPHKPVFTECDNQVQGISVGWADVYDRSLPDQWIDVTEVPSGRYWLEVEVDPDNQLLESDETNNITRIPIFLSKNSVH